MTHMDDISPKYLMSLIRNIERATWEEYKSYKEVLFYIDKWHKENDYDSWENFSII